MNVRCAACYLAIAGFALASSAACSIFDDPNSPTAVAPQTEGEPNMLSEVEPRVRLEQETVEPAAARSGALRSVPLDGLPWIATGPVAIVDGFAIPARAFNQLMYERALGFPRALPTSGTVDVLVESLVDRYLIERELRAVGIRVSTDEIDVELASYEAVSEREVDLRSDPLWAERRERARVGIGLRKLVQEYGLEVTDEDVRSEYEQHPSRYQVAAEVKASHILVKVRPGEANAASLAAAKSRAARIAAEAQAGTDFAELARRHSDGPTASRGGDLGFFEHRRMVPPFADGAFALERGEVSAPVRSQFGLHIIKVFDRRDARTIPLEEVRAQIVERLEQEALRSASLRLKRELRDQAEIVKLRDNIEKGSTSPW